jgi:hypothetical protein
VYGCCGGHTDTLNEDKLEELRLMGRVTLDVMVEAGESRAQHA